MLSLSGKVDVLKSRHVPPIDIYVNWLWHFLETDQRVQTKPCGILVTK